MWHVMVLIAGSSRNSSEMAELKLAYAKLRLPPLRAPGLPCVMLVPVHASCQTPKDKRSGPGPCYLCSIYGFRCAYLQRCKHLSMVLSIVHLCYLWAATHSFSLRIDSNKQSFVDHTQQSLRNKQEKQCVQIWIDMKITWINLQVVLVIDSDRQEFC